MQFFSFARFALQGRKSNIVVTEFITKLVSWEFSPAMFRSKITELIIGEFSSGSSLQDFVHRISVWSVIGSVNGEVFSEIGPKNYQINSLGIVSGNDPVKNCRK